jgi:hypothetical protein
MPVNKQDSNLSGLRYAKETSIGVLGSAIWIQLEPNSYSDFGAQYSQVARNPINALRQRKKGALVDVDASGGFNQDLTIGNTLDLLQGFMFAAAREKATSAPLNSAAVALTATTTTAYNAAAGLGAFNVSTAGNLVKGSGFVQAANNGLKLITAASATALTTTGLVVETPPATAKVETVGHQFGAGVAAITMSGSIVQFAATGVDALGLIVGEWVYVGGDGAGFTFATANIGFARIKSVAAGVLQFDKITGTNGAADAGAGKTIQIFYGNIVRNETTAAQIVRTTYNLERSLGVGNAGALVQAEYLEGSVPNQFTINVPQADKVNVDFSFASIRHTFNDSATGPKAGTRPTLGDFPPFDTAASTPRIRLGKVDTTTSIVTPLYAYSSDLKLTGNNNVSINKALGVLGGFDATVGNFEVGGSMSSYLQDVTAVNAVKLLQDCTLDFAVVETNGGYVVDLPLVTLGDGRNDVQQDSAVMANLDIQAVQCPAGYTMLVNQFPYLPTAAG